MYSKEKIPETVKTLKLSLKDPHRGGWPLFWPEGERHFTKDNLMEEVSCSYIRCKKGKFKILRQIMVDLVENKTSSTGLIFCSGRDIRGYGCQCTLRYKLEVEYI